MEEQLYRIISARFNDEPNETISDLTTHILLTEFEIDSHISNSDLPNIPLAELLCTIECDIFHRELTLNIKVPKVINGHVISVILPVQLLISHAEIDSSGVIEDRKSVDATNLCFQCEVNDIAVEFMLTTNTKIDVLNISEEPQKSICVDFGGIVSRETALNYFTSNYDHTPGKWVVDSFYYTNNLWLKPKYTVVSGWGSSARKWQFSYTGDIVRK